MSPLASWCLVIGLLMFAAVLAKLLSVGAFSITTKRSVQIDREYADQLRKQQLDAAFRVTGTPILHHKPRAGQQRVGNGR